MRGVEVQDHCGHYKHWWLVMLTGIWGLKTLACRTVEAVGCGTVPVVG